MVKRRRFTVDFRAWVALEAFCGDKTVQEIAAKLKMHPNQVSTWKRQAIDFQIARAAVTFFALALYAIVAVGVGTAHADSETPLFIPCDDAPAEAVLKIPEPFDKFAGISCSKYGHFIESAKGLLWTFPGGLKPVVFAAQGEIDTPEALVHEAHFVSVRLITPPREEQNQRIEDFERFLNFEVEREEIRVANLRAEASTGLVQNIYFAVIRGKRRFSMWGMGCLSDCTLRDGTMNGKPFLVIGK